jgi:hypothetical protein
LCGMEMKTSDFDLDLAKKCANCCHTFHVHYVDKG